MDKIYLDNAATTKPCEAAEAEIRRLFEEKTYGNPSSLHHMGLEADQLISRARHTVAQTLGAKKSEVYFAPSGTVANNTAIIGAAYTYRRRGNRIITTDSEHPSVKEPLMQLRKEEGWEIIEIPTRGGKVDLDAFSAALNEKTVLISMMSVNNETGALYDLAGVRSIIDRCPFYQTAPKPLFHCDAVQAYMKIPIRADLFDLISVSAHKIHGLKGTGALYIKNGIRLKPLYAGGGQENGLFPGTENLTGIVAFAAAAQDSAKHFAAHVQHMKILQDYTREKLSSIPDVRFNTPPEAAPHILSVTIAGIKSEVMLRHLSGGGICISSGSACSSRGTENRGRTRVLEAFGLNRHDADCTIRMSLSRYNRIEDIDILCDGIRDGIGNLIKI